MVVQKGIDSGAITQVQTPSEGVDLAHRWLNEPEQLLKLKEQAKIFSQSYVGATDRTMAVLEALWNQK